MGKISSDAIALENTSEVVINPATEEKQDDIINALGSSTSSPDSAHLVDPKSLTEQHISHFGAAKVSTAIPVVKGNFPGSELSSAIWDEIDINGGSVTVERGVGKLQTGTNSAGSVKLISTQKGRFEAGQVTVYQSGVYAGAGVADNLRRWGMMDRSEENGLFFELDGTTFKVIARAGGTDTEVESSSFNGDTSFVPGDSNNTYRIHYSAGRALFFRASAGNLILLHSMVDTAYPLVEDLDLSMYYENTNTGNTTDVEMRVRGASISVLGDLRQFNDGGALITGDFFSEVGLNKIENYGIGTKFGRNPDIDTGSTPEDLWNGGSTYTGFNATANQNLRVNSSSSQDSGTLVDSGTCDSGTKTTLVDADGDFITDGVAVGDILVNDTQGIHGAITARTATTITVFAMVDGGRAGVFRNNPGDTYRVVTTNGTGAALVKFTRILNNIFEKQTDIYVIMNGTSNVDTTADVMRCSRAKVILAGSNGSNVGTITGRQATTTANIFLQMPVGLNQTTIGADTVPAGKIYQVKRIRVAITRANGSAGSATITLKARNYGEVFRAIRAFEVQTGDATEFTQLGGDTLPAGTDIKFTIEAVSDNNTVVDGAFEYVELTV